MDTNETYDFVQYSEVSLSQDLLRSKNGLVSIETMESVLHITVVLLSGVSVNRGSTVGLCTSLIGTR